MIDLAETLYAEQSFNSAHGDITTEFLNFSTGLNGTCMNFYSYVGSPGGAAPAKGKQCSVKKIEKERKKMITVISGANEKGWGRCPKHNMRGISSVEKIN